MSIDFLFELARSLDVGKEIFACVGVGRNQWYIGKPLDELQKLAKRSADNKKMPVNIVKLVPPDDTLPNDQFLVPIRIEDAGARGEPQIQWATVETKEAGEMMRDLRHGSAPFFGMQVVETISPA